MVDDEQENIELITRAFRDRYEVLAAHDGASGLELAQRHAPDVVITDQRMPGLSGVELLAILERELPHAVRILVTAFADYDSVVYAVNQAHIHHYVEKPLQAVSLVTVVNSLVRTMELEREHANLVQKLSNALRDLDRANTLLAESEAGLQREVVERTQQLSHAHEELRRVNELLRQMAVRDNLTSLFNHRYLLEHLTLEIARAKRYQRGLGLILIDLDNFRGINESRGHAAGDQALVEISKLVQGDSSLSGLRHSDFVARFGGDEFCLLLPETNREGTITKAERLRRAIATCASGVTASFGVASYPEDGIGGDELMEALNTALAAAKSLGRDRVCDAAGEVRAFDGP